MSFAIAQKTSQAKKRVTANGGVHGALKSPQSQDFNSPVPVIQRKPICACEGGCPRCQSSFPIQAKLKIGQPDDKYEQEADRVAERVMKMSEPSIQPNPTRPFACGPSCGEEDKIVRRKSISDHIVPVFQQHPGKDGERLIQTKQDFSKVVPSASHILSGITSTSGGTPLSDTVRGRVEPIIGADLGHVRVHNDTDANSSAISMNAKAFTHKNHIWLGSGESAEDNRLMAHELTHVVQQGAGIRSCPIIQLKKQTQTEEETNSGITTDIVSNVLEEEWHELVLDYKNRADTHTDAAEQAEAARVVLLLEQTRPEVFEGYTELHDFIDSVRFDAVFEHDTLQELEWNEYPREFSLRTAKAFPNTWSFRVEELIVPEEDLIDSLKKQAISDRHDWVDTSEKNLPKHLAEEGLPVDFLGSLNLGEFHGFPDKLWVFWFIVLNSPSFRSENIELDQLIPSVRNLTKPKLLKNYVIGLIEWLESAAKYDLAREWQIQAMRIVQGISDSKFVVNYDKYLSYGREKLRTLNDLLGVPVNGDLSESVEEGFIQLEHSVINIAKTSRIKAAVGLLENLRIYGNWFSQYLDRADQIIKSLEPGHTQAEALIRLKENLNPLQMINRHFNVLGKASAAFKPCGTVAPVESESRLGRAERWACRKNFSSAALSEFLSQLKNQLGEIIESSIKEGLAEFIIGLHPWGRAAVIVKEIGEALIGMIESVINIGDAEDRVRKAKTVVNLQRESATLALAKISNGANLLLSIASLRSSINDLKVEVPPTRGELPPSKKTEPETKEPDIPTAGRGLPLRKIDPPPGWRHLTEEDLDFLEKTWDVPSKKLSNSDAQKELKIARSGRSEDIDTGEYVEKIELPNTHDWKRQRLHDSTWCRFSTKKCITGETGKGKKGDKSGPAEAKSRTNRPTPTRAERDAHDYLQRHYPASDWETQALFLHGNRATPSRGYNPRGSTQPDSYSAELGVAAEVKAWDVSESYEKMIANIIEQQGGRASSLPAGTEQWLLVDIRRQNIKSGIAQLGQRIREDVGGDNLFTTIFLITDSDVHVVN